jgi:methylmalonyl-CoA/ethylmalonyl-CoA epimerase
VSGDATALHQVAQHVDDLERAVAFYRDTLGLPLIATFDPPGLAFFDLGETRLLLEAGAPSALLYLRVGDIGRRFAELRAAGVTFEDEPHLIHRDDDGRFGPAGNEEWMTFFRDSEQNLLGLVERRLAPLNPA